MPTPSIRPRTPQSRRWAPALIPSTSTSKKRREGIIAFIDRVGPDGRHAVVEDVQFDDDRIHDVPTG
jgi:hypothetical protein